jgi:hypothetical protein
MAKIIVILMISFFSVLGWSQGITANTITCRPDLNLPSSIFQTAVTNLQGFAYINQALQSLHDGIGHPSYCVSSMALSKNQYQYFRYYIQIDVYYKYEPNPVRSLRFLMQDASTQAFQNIGTQPWIGLSTQGTDAVFDQVLANADFKPVSAPTIGLTTLQAAMQSTTWQKNITNMDTSTVSIFRVMTKNYGLFNRSVFLVSWMTKPSNNPYATPVASQGVLLTQSDDGQWLFAENISMFSDILMPLDHLLETTVPATNSVDAWTEQLLNISL